MAVAVYWDFENVHAALAVDLEQLSGEVRKEMEANNGAAGPHD